MFLKRLCFIVFSCLVLSANTLAKDGNNPSFGMRLYSNIEYIEEAGDFIGLQVEFIPYQNSMQILWRFAEGPIFRSLLLEAEGDVKVYKIVFPQDSDHAGEWTLTISKNDKNLHVKGPKNVQYDLKLVPFK